MQVKMIANTKDSALYTISKNSSIHEAITKLTEFKIGALLVMEGKTVDGIISERDILNVCSRCQSDNVCSIKVSEIMTTNVVFAEMDDDLMEVMEVMRHRHIRHLPLRSNGEVTGMVSMRDVNSTLLDAMSDENEQLVNYITGRYVT